MKFYSNVVCTTLIMLLAANFCYGMEEVQSMKTVVTPHSDLTTKLENTLLILQKPKKQDAKSFSQEIYESEKKMQEAWQTLQAAIKNEPSQIVELRKPIIKIRYSISQRLRNKEKELPNISQPELMESSNQIKFTIQIAKTLQNLHRVELSKIENKKEEEVNIETNSFINNFATTAKLISSPNIVFDEYDQELIKYIINSSFFKDHFIDLTLAPEGKKTDFEKAYAIIREKLGLPAMVTEPEEPKKEQISPEIVIPNEPKKAAPETLEIESNEEAIKRAAAIIAQEQRATIQQQPEASRKEPEVAEQGTIIVNQAQPQEEPQYEIMEPFRLLGQGIAYVISKIGAALSWIRGLLPW